MKEDYLEEANKKLEHQSQRTRQRGRGRPPTKRKEVGYVQFEDERAACFLNKANPQGDETTNRANEGIPQSAHPVDAPSADMPAVISKASADQPPARLAYARCNWRHWCWTIQFRTSDEGAG